jgi:hypothetical protein
VGSVRSTGRGLLVLAVCAAAASFALTVSPVGPGSTVSASCATGAPPELTRVTGQATSVTERRPDGVIVELAADNGATWTVEFSGRTLERLADGTENTVEDAWKGDLPIVGGRYSIAGWRAGDQLRLLMDACVNAEVELLGAPAPSVAPADAAASAPPVTSRLTSADEVDDGASPAPFLAIGLGVVVAAGIVVLRRRAAGRS